MTAQIRPAPVRKSIRVNATPDRAFDVFTSGIGRWWPKSHKIGQADLDRPVIEPRAGGRWYELDVDGSECELGKVAVWEPPSRLILIWQLTPEFRFDPDLITEVEVTFTPDGDGTVVDLEHRDLERMGDQAEAMAETVGGPGGWPALLQLFADETHN
ncbi:MAG TPA: SRPBCC family protein [Sphingomicrobium sp.]|nr:SRPBCC family protein [Sphingomicrobium sp.]